MKLYLVEKTQKTSLGIINDIETNGVWNFIIYTENTKYFYDTNKHLIVNNIGLPVQVWIAERYYKREKILRKNSDNNCFIPLARIPGTVLNKNNKNFSKKTYQWCRKNDIKYKYVKHGQEIIGVIFDSEMSLMHFTLTWH